MGFWSKVGRAVVTAKDPDAGLVNGIKSWVKDRKDRDDAEAERKRKDTEKALHDALADDKDEDDKA